VVIIVISIIAFWNNVQFLPGTATYQELMSSEAAEERATTAYARVPSKSKLLASESPKRDTGPEGEGHNEDIKTHVFCGSRLSLWGGLQGE